VKISIVIPTMNRMTSLQRVVSGLMAQTYPNHQFEVIVVSDGSTDGTDAYLTGLTTPFRLLPVLQSNRGVASARNAGIAAAEGKLIIFLDDDTVPAPDFLEEHARLQDTYNGQAVVIGPMHMPPLPWRPAPWVGWELSRLAEQYHSMLSGDWQPTPRQFYTANASVARQKLIQAGGFDPRFRRAEDVELAYRLEEGGVPFVFAPQAIVYHYAERSFAAWKAIPYAYGVNDVIFAQQKGQSWLLPTVYREYHTRHPLTKSITWLCLSHGLLTRVLTLFLKQFSLLTDRLGMIKLSQLACSGIFNMYYYQGISDGLGSRKAFFSATRTAVPTT
jgi:glycosyltransferase involved in cell wall biosynthesis